VILLDTNVISALMLSPPEMRVAAWLNRQAPEAVWTTSITVFEIEVGLASMPAGRRQHALIERFGLMLRTALGSRVAAFDRPAAEAAARLTAQRRRSGRPVALEDTQIAGIALARRAAIATRNIGDFHGVNTPVINPWQTTP
jgi:predicted nucleic acid-binding protein